jgi:hypothetical protein
MEGSIPDEVDHINHNRTDNRWNNLRAVTSKSNSRNQSKSIKNKSGVTGVHWDNLRNRWIAQIHIDYKTVHLGTFVEFHEAVNARKNAEVLYGFHENHGK